MKNLHEELGMAWFIWWLSYSGFTSFTFWTWWWSTAFNHIKIITQ